MINTKYECNNQVSENDGKKYGVQIILPLFVCNLAAFLALPLRREVHSDECSSPLPRPFQGQTPLQNNNNNNKNVKTKSFLSATKIRKQKYCLLQFYQTSVIQPKIARTILVIHLPHIP